MKYWPPINGNLEDPDRPYVNANPGIGVTGSYPDARGLEHPQREILNAISDAGLVPAEGDLTQLSTAIKILADRAIPVGTVFLFTGTAAPTGFVKGNGGLLPRVGGYAPLYAHAVASGMIVTDAAWLAGDTGKFSEGDGATTFRLPLLHAEFPRFWDDGRGVDAARALGSWQKASGVSVDDNGTASAYVTQLSGTSDTGSQAVALQRLGLDAVNPADYAGTEPTWRDAQGVGGFSTAGMRPRNVAYLGIIKY